MLSKFDVLALDLIETRNTLGAVRSRKGGEITHTIGEGQVSEVDRCVSSVPNARLVHRVPAALLDDWLLCWVKPVTFRTEI